MKLFLNSVLLMAASSTLFAQFAPGVVSPAPPAVPAIPGFPAAGTTAGNVPAATTPPAPVALAPTSHSISFDVKLLRSGGASNMNQNSGLTGTGTTRTSSTNSRERGKLSQLQLEVDVRNFAKRPDQVTVEWTFFSEYVDENTAYVSKPDKDKDPLRILSNGSQAVTLKPGGSEKINFESAAARLFESRSSTVSSTRESSTRTTIATANHAMKIGYKTAGWFVRVKADDKILGVKASSQRLEKLALDDAALAAIPQTDNAILKGLDR